MFASKEELELLRNEVNGIMDRPMSDEQRSMLLQISEEINQMFRMLDSVDAFIEAHSEYDQSQVRIEQEAFLYYGSEIIAVYNKQTKKFELIKDIV